MMAGGWDDCNGDVHVSIILWQHGGAEVEIFKVSHHALSSSGGRDHTAQEPLGSYDVCCFGADMQTPCPRKNSHINRRSIEK